MNTRTILSALAITPAVLLTVQLAHAHSGSHGETTLGQSAYALVAHVLSSPDHLIALVSAAAVLGLGIAWWRAKDREDRS